MCGKHTQGSINGCHDFVEFTLKSTLRNILFRSVSLRPSIGLHLASSSVTHNLSYNTISLWVV